MTSEERLAELCALLIQRQVRLEAQTEVILKALAQFVGATTHKDWQALFRDLEQQTNESAELRRLVVEAELRRLRTSR